MRWWPTFCLLLAAPAPAQQVDFGALKRYGAACTMLEAAILTDKGAVNMDDHVIEWISECNQPPGLLGCAQGHTREAKRASPLDCLGRVQSAEAASAAYSLYLDKTSPLPKCIERRS